MNALHGDNLFSISGRGPESLSQAKLLGCYYISESYLTSKIILVRYKLSL